MCCIFSFLLVQTPSSTSNAEPVPIGTILAVVFGFCVILLLLIIGLIFIWMCVKKKREEGLQAVNEGPETIEIVYEDPDDALGHNIQPGFTQNREVRTADNVAYSTQLQVVQERVVQTQDNLAYGVVSTLS